MKAHQADHSVVLLCKVLGLSRSGYVRLSTTYQSETANIRLAPDRSQVSDPPCCPGA